MQTVFTYYAQIFVGLREGYGDYVHNLDDVRMICKEYVNKVGLGVTVTPTEFIYTDGGEPGAIIGIINYPRFPSTHETIKEHAMNIATKLLEALKQERLSILYPDKTVMIEKEAQ